MAASLSLPENETITVTVGVRRVLEPSGKVEEDVSAETVLTTTEIHQSQGEHEDWRNPFVDYLQHGRLPNDRAKRTEVRRRVIQFLMWKDVLYKRSLDGILMRCIGKEEIQEVMREIHAGVCGAHQTGPKLKMQIKRLGYYWPTMISDCIEFAKRCQACQYHGDFIHRPPEPLHVTTCSWPFAAWGMDVMGPFTPPSSKGHRPSSHGFLLKMG